MEDAMKCSNTKISLKTPIGFVTMVTTAIGIKEIHLDKSYNSDIRIVSRQLNDLSVEVVGIKGEMTRVAEISLAWMKEFFDASRSGDQVPDIDNEIVSRDSFTGLVLRTLMDKTRPGVTVSYTELAKLCNSPKACRAVGQAMRANPLPLLVPCHRVVASNGGLGHYMSGDGDNIKAWLLHMEKERKL